jgi:undecaprenyl diphosphate synthase
MNKLNHVAFIMDGNGRWGQQRNKGRNFGHFNGVETVKKIVEKSVKLKIPIITFYVFSTENWKRPKSEINFLFKLIINYFKQELDRVILNGIKINIIGKINKLPLKIKLALKDSVKKTEKNKKIIVNLAINYGSRDEIVDACKKTNNKISIQSLSKNLYTKSLANPDILIRTGGHKRLSNFMLWQLAYTEIYFIDKLWPDFNNRDFERIVNNFKKIKRNFGSI